MPVYSYALGDGFADGCRERYPLARGTAQP
jgi:hypothetical protein